ncbi:hypothetical protein FPHOBKDP_00121 [Listeria phage LPJP1]|nr:hypothetical protein FPHOBKDP_00121 [Listeria phage LPJP1]
MKDTFFNYNNEESSMQTLEESLSYLEEANIVRLDKRTAKKRLYTQAVLISAKEANDPLYRKYVKYSKLRRETRRAIQLKYASKGKQKLREFGEKRKAKSESKKVEDK